jgi:hypothetical protein
MRGSKVAIGGSGNRGGFYGGGCELMAGGWPTADDVNKIPLK